MSGSVCYAFFKVQSVFVVTTVVSVSNFGLALIYLVVTSTRFLHFFS